MSPPTTTTTEFQPSYKRVAVYESRTPAGGTPLVPDVGEWCWFSPIVYFTSEKYADIANDVLSAFVEEAVGLYLVTHILVIEFPTLDAFASVNMRSL